MAGFTDSDFGGGGTDLKGYTVGGSLALSKFQNLIQNYQAKLVEQRIPPVESEITKESFEFTRNPAVISLGCVP